MDERTEALVLRTRVFTETSLVVQWLTRDFGRVTTVAKGALRPKSPFRGKIDLFYIVDITFHRARSSDLHNLREAVVIDSQPSLRTTIELLSKASYAVRFIEQTTEADTPLPNMFQMVAGFLKFIPGHPVHSTLILGLELKLLFELGLEPHGGKSSLSPGSARIARALVEMPWEGIVRLRPSPSQLREIEQFLHGFIIYHLGKIPPGRSEALRAAST